MYYENKRSFYIKQYGPAAIIILVSIVCIVAGVVLGFKDNTIVAVKDDIVEVNSYEVSEKAVKGEVISVNGLTITVKSQDTNYEIDLIGIAQNNKNTKLSENIKSDLVGKTVTIDYDVATKENGKTYGYIYLDKVLYNESLLKAGKAELRTERQNTSMLNTLVAAQIEARHNGIGIWAY